MTTTQERRCSFTDLYVSMCAHCRGDHLDPLIEEMAAEAYVTPPSGRRSADGEDPLGHEIEAPVALSHKATRWTSAKRAQDCPTGCGTSIMIGDPVGLVGDHWVCASCAGGT